ncbi:hypothetical protein I3843_05G037900 [Carya illinoinensis]|nr:hypothetical protein I3843_05G037900 [Carya illinoinensis]
MGLWSCSWITKLQLLKFKVHAQTTTRLKSVSWKLIRRAKRQVQIVDEERCQMFEAWGLARESALLSFHQDSPETASVKHEVLHKSRRFVVHFVR